MAKFTQHTGIVVSLDATNVDTDCDHPQAVFAKSDRTGFRQYLFNDWRFLDDAGQQPNPDVVVSLVARPTPVGPDDDRRATLCATVPPHPLPLGNAAYNVRCATSCAQKKPAPCVAG